MGHNNKTKSKIRGTEEEEETQVKGKENVFYKIIEESSPNLKNEAPMKIQEAYKTLNRKDQKKKFPHET